MGITLNAQVIFSKGAIFMMLTLLIREHGRDSTFCILFNPFSQWLRDLSWKSLTSLVKFISSYYLFV